MFDASQLKKLYESNSGDLTIVLRSGSKIRVISHFLTQISPVFDKMLRTDMLEAKDKIIDLSAYCDTSVDILLRNIYYNYSPLDSKKNVWHHNICETISLLNIYQIDKLKNKLISHIERHIASDDLNRTLSMLIDFQDYGTLFENIKIKYCNHLASMFNRSTCYDLIGESKYGWCCMHSYKKVDNKYCTYLVNVDKIEKYGCVCVNLKKKNCEPSLLKYDMESVAVTDKFYAGRCCTHKNSNVTGSYNYEYFMKLPEDVRNHILKKLFH